MQRELRTNYRIRVPEIRLVGENGEQIGVLPTAEALKKAQEAGLDLVEISASARPPVCRIMDYGKYKYKLKKKEHDARKHQTVVQLKEVKMRPSTGEHDLEVKINNIKRFLGDRNKAKVTVVFRGREMAHTEQGKVLMDRIAKAVEREGKVETPARREGRSMSMILSPQ